VASCYVRIDDDVGLKLFSTAEHRDRARKRQKKVSERDLAPAVGDTMTLPDEFHELPLLQLESYFPGNDRSGPCIYGYLTQAAETDRRIEKGGKAKLIEMLKNMDNSEAPEDIEDQDENIGYVGDELVYLDFDDGTWSTGDTME
jgi:hypothetical protein